jgi:hypothetical protein
MTKIFVFGSNLAGVHGAGAAALAHRTLNAQWGVGIGRTGQCYAIPTKNQRIRTLPLDRIKEHINDFIEYAEHNPLLTFQVTRIGCGLAGFDDKDIAPLFKGAPTNCEFDLQWQQYLGLENRSYWGTY